MTYAEIETKLAVDPAFVVPDLADLDHGIVQVERSGPATLRATYVDTKTLRLARDAITLRHRSGEGSPRWTLKLPAGGKQSTGLSRTELSVDGPAGDVPGELADLLVGQLRGEPIGPVAVLTTARTTYRLLDAAGSLLGEVVDDAVTARTGRKILARFREVEVEQTDAEQSARACRAAVRTLQQAGAVVDEQLPKLVRALGEEARGPSDLPAPPDVRGKSPAADLVRWSLRTGLRRLVTADVGVRRNSPDAVHQMRVACRRMRSDIRTFAPLLDDPRATALREELRWLAGTLGDARDLEVLLVRMGRTAMADRLCPLDDSALSVLRSLLLQQEEVALAQVREALASERYVQVLRLLEQIAADPLVTARAGEPCDRVLPELVAVPWRSLVRRARRLGPDDPDDDWHRARILAKRARYAAEVAAVAEGRPAKRTAKAATALQELLGEHQDAAVAAERFLELAHTAGLSVDVVVTCGRLAERERASLRDLRLAYAPVWKQISRSKAADWL